MSREYPTNSDEIIDSRYVIERIEELEDERDTLVEDIKESLDEFEEHAGESYDEATVGRIVDDAKLVVLEASILERRATLVEWDDDNGELKELKELASGCSDYSDWKDGVMLIRDNYFETYAQQFAEDTGAIPKDLSWPACHIDWEAACESLQQDYTAVEWDGVTYWYR
jgi:uncharacterized protein (UPF0335 family)